MAARAGLGRLSEQHVNELARSVASGRELSERLPKDLHWTEEPALIFRLPLPERGKP
jgi:hypothetical protein